MELLSIHNLHISVEGTHSTGSGREEVVHGLNLTVNEGEIHAIMGPNGSGKSTLVNSLMGHPKYTITQGSAHFQGKDLLTMEPHERANLGLFLAFQYPKEIAGVTLRSFLFAAYKAQTAARGSEGALRAGARSPDKKIISPIKFKKYLEEKMRSLHMDPAFAERHLNQGFSGGEKKKAEVLQLSVLEPHLALLDETDSGLDIDALKIVSEGVNAMRSPTFSAIIVTHYARILDYITPDRVHVMVQGKIVESGAQTLALQLEREGYRKYGIIA